METNRTDRSIRIQNGISVTVPASTKLMTAYILQEQKGWFEDEMEFLEAFIKPGMSVIDVGANYGLYTLTLSKLIGDTGKIWAFEPTSETAGYLEKSIVENQITNIQLIQAALSNRIGKAKFYTWSNSEWNSLSESEVGYDSSETVGLLTLDHCQDKYGWKDIDFLKLDAEGEELNILKGGKRFLTSESPLVMYELKHDDKVNLPLINGFKDLGYNSYRYIRSLNILLPFDHRYPVDDFQLNLFACKGDGIANLESSGLLVNTREREECTPDINIIDEYLTDFPFWQLLREKIDPEDSPSKTYLEILSLYILAITNAGNASAKYNYLRTALIGIKKLMEQGEGRIERLTTFSRIAFDCGERSLGVKILAALIDKYFDNLNFEIADPFLPAAAKYDQLETGGNLKIWLFSSVLEQFIIKHSYSTYFTQRRSLPIFTRLEQLGFMDGEMARRKKMIEVNFPD